MRSWRSDNRKGFSHSKFCLHTKSPVSSLKPLTKGEERARVISASGFAPECSLKALKSLFLLSSLVSPFLCLQDWIRVQFVLTGKTLGIPSKRSSPISVVFQIPLFPLQVMVSYITLRVYSLCLFHPIILHLECLLACHPNEMDLMSWIICSWNYSKFFSKFLCIFSRLWKIFDNDSQWSL